MLSTEPCSGRIFLPCHSLTYLFPSKTVQFSMKSCYMCFVRTAKISLLGLSLLQGTSAPAKLVGLSHYQLINGCRVAAEAIGVDTTVLFYRIYILYTSQLIFSLLLMHVWEGNRQANDRVSYVINWIKMTWSISAMGGG